MSRSRDSMSRSRDSMSYNSTCPHAPRLQRRARQESKARKGGESLREGGSPERMCRSGLGEA
eukprot:1900541-Rhodomonas_salina.1